MRKLAEICRYRGLIDRNPWLSLRTPEATSLAPSTAFNRHTVGEFAIVRVSGKKSYRLFVAKILSKSGIGLSVQFYKKAPLSKPVSGSSGRFKDMLSFSKDLSNYMNTLD